ncbi:MAG: nuclear transport factor 2 family protein [Acidobacteriota bacterium]|nr:nuclear transport factor 2 family protein [Acidobacteriota bacterium]
MKQRILTIILSLLVFQTAMAQTANQVRQANPTDVSSIDAIIKAVYDVISGEAGKPRDWDRFRTLFHKDARLIPSGKNPQTGIIGARALTPEEYITRSSPFMEKEGFFEREMARRIDSYGNIAQVFSTYQSFHKADDKKPFARGINSFQLLNDGKRWWIVTIYWQGETAETPIPKKYLKSKN